MKACFKCGEEKELSLFYRHKMMADGHLNKCISCTKNDVAKHRILNINKIREYDRGRGNRQNPEYIKEWRSENPKAYKAHCAINNALKNGRIKKLPCEICGELKSVAHHDDYDYPLSVRWMCQAHHKQWHEKNGEGLNPA